MCVCVIKHPHENVPKSSLVHPSQDSFIAKYYVKTRKKTIRAIARTRITFPCSFNHKDCGVKNQFERRIIRGACYWLPVLICQSAEAGLCSCSQEARDARAVLFYCVGALRTSRAQSERQVNGVRRTQLDFNQGEVIVGACSIDCSSLHLDKHHQQRAEKRKSEESVLTATGQLL